jgi:hypothetical protein
LLDVTIQRDIVPQADLRLQGGWERWLKLGTDIAPTLAILAAQGPIAPRLIACDDAGQLILSGNIVSPLPLGVPHNLADNVSIPAGTPSNIFDSLGAPYMTIVGRVDVNVQARILAGVTADDLIIVAAPPVGPTVEIWYNAANAFRYWAVQFDDPSDGVIATALAKY